MSGSKHSAKKFKERIFRIIQIGSTDDLPSRLFDYIIVTAIFLNIAILIMYTFDIFDPYRAVLGAVETGILIMFSVEYVLRLWTSDLLYPKYKQPISMLHFIGSFDGIVDLLTILPFFFLSGFIALRILRVARIFRLFKINKRYDSFNVIKNVLYDKRNQIISSVFIIIILMMGASLGVYAAEHEAQPEIFKNAFSGIWWAVSTLLTVGYGDIYPVTIMGQIMGIITAFFGVGVVAIPTGIISAGFVEQYTKAKKEKYFDKEVALQFVTITVTKGHNWENHKVKEANIPQGLVLAIILRHGETIVPEGNIIIKSGDRLVLAAESYVDELGIKLNEVRIDSEHEWVNKRVRDLDISQLTTIISIMRRHKMIIPHGNTLIKADDDILIYSKSDVDIGGNEIRL